MIDIDDRQRPHVYVDADVLMIEDRKKGVSS